MARIALDDYRRERVSELIVKFFEATAMVKRMCDAGCTFKEVHFYQLKAADAIHAIDDEDLLHVAQEMYPWEKDTMKEYLEIYNESQSGKEQ